MIDTSVPAGSPRLAQQVLFSSGTLPPGSHALQVVKRGGTYMTIDAVRVQAM